MKRFTFRLQHLLNYKGYLERLARQDTAKARLDIVDCDKQIAALKQQVLVAAKQMDSQVKDGICAREFKQHQGFLSAMETDMEDEKIRKKSLEKVWEEKQVVLQKRSTEKKSMDHLREKQARVYAEKMLKMEEKELDEISTLKTAREIGHDTE
ncbi:MAG: flagellar export protein FliJ [Desulfotignum sp.]|nr:flagellar export protein FliJ [Desulfobacteraceae bacterium]